MRPREKTEVECDVDRCPVCGIGFDAVTIALPQIKHAQYDLSGNLVDWTLYWHCPECGAEWRHGQWRVEG